MKPTFYAFLVVVAVLSGCSSGKSTFERGNYYEAVLTSVNRLRKNSDHKKSVETLRQAYPLAVSFYEDRAKLALASNERFKWGEVVKSYTLINNMYDEIKRCPGALAVVPNPINYFSKLQEARQNAAEEAYAAGILSLQGSTRDDAKVAYGYFKTANDYAPGYKEVNDYLQAALDAATVKILVEPIPVHSKTVGVSADFFNDKISEFVHGAAISEFVKFYTRAEAQTLKLNPDHIIQLSFDEFAVGEVFKHEREIQLSKDSVVLGTYASPVAAQPQDNAASKTASTRSDLVGTGVLVSTRNPVTQTSPTNTPVSAQPAADTEADRERAAKELDAKRKLEEQQNALAAKQQAEREAAERERLAKAAEADRLAKEAAEKARLEQQRAEQERLAKEQAEKALAEKAKAEKEKAEREQAAKALAEKEKAEREKAEKENMADASIKPEDTVNITDPVTVCHIPPGNPMNARTLKINRSALKAHLAHGDSEGACDTNKKGPKEKPNEGTKGPKGQPADKKGKGPGGSAKIGSPDLAHPLLFDASQVIVASVDGNPASFLRYLSAVADTNKVYGTVKATLYHYTKTTTSKGVVSFRIIDAKTGALLAVEKMPGEYVWKSEWATFNGDERALSAQQLALTKQKEVPAPPPQELFIEFTRPIYDQITSRIREFYRGY